MNRRKEKYISKNKAEALNSYFHSKKIQRMKKTYQEEKRRKKRRVEEKRKNGNKGSRKVGIFKISLLRITSFPKEQSSTTKPKTYKRI